MYKHAVVHAEDRPARRTTPGSTHSTAAASSSARPQAVHADARAAGVCARLALAVLVTCAIVGALWTYHDLRHPQDNLSPATPLLGIALLVLVTRMRHRPR